MKFQSSLIVASLAALSNAQTAEVLGAIVSDIQANSLEYLSYIIAGHSPPAGVLNLYQQISTYTDDSYTTLYNEVDLAAVSTFITALPWYSSRLEGEIEAAVGGASTAPTETSSSAAPDTSSSAAPTSSSAAPETSSSSAAPETSSSTAPKTSSSSAVETTSSKSEASKETSSTSAESSSASLETATGAGNSLNPLLAAPLAIVFGSLFL